MGIEYSDRGMRSLQTMQTIRRWDPLKFQNIHRCEPDH